MPEQSATTATPRQQQPTAAEAGGRNVWIVTGYVASLLALLGVMAYHFSAYLYQ